MMHQEKSYDLSCKINGKFYTFELESRELLAQTLRERAGLLSVHIACDTNSCGACTVNLDGRLIKACSLLSVQVQGQTVITVEGAENIYPVAVISSVNQAFSDSKAFQCGFCTPAILLNIYQLLTDKKNPSNEDIRQSIAGTLCRCTGYQPIINAVELAIKTLSLHN